MVEPPAAARRKGAGVVVTGHDVRRGTCPKVWKETHQVGWAFVQAYA